MNINRNNYEEFFMLYADNELDAAGKAQVEEFIAGNPDLKTELDLFREVKLSADTNLVFADKPSLLKQETGHTGITARNYESYFVLYADDELTGEEKAAVEGFVLRNPALQAEFTLLQQARISADSHIIYQNKQSLYRHEKDDKVVPFRWWRIAAAAAVLLFVSGLVWINTKKDDAGTGMAIIQTKPVAPAKSTMVPVTGKSTAEKNDEEQQPAAPVVAAIDQPDGDKPAKNNLTPVQPAVAMPGKLKNKGSNIPDQQNVISTDEVAKNIESTTIDPLKHKTAGTDMKGPLIAAATEPMIDQPAIILNPDENKTRVEYASLNNDNVEVLNTTVNTKNALRGFLRKASRLIAKKTNSGDEEGNRKGILIGGFEIAVR